MNSSLNHDKTWRAKFFLRWPSLKDYYTDIESKGATVDYSREMQIRGQLEKGLLFTLGEIANKYFIRKVITSDIVEEFKNLLKLSDNPRLRLMVLDELVSLLSSKKANLTQKYYAKYALRFLRREYITEQWKDLNFADTIKYLEESMIFLSEWLHEDQLAINVSISSQLNDLADQVKESLRLKNPTHMLFSVSSEIFKKWRSKNLLDNKFNFEETQEILDCQCELFNGLNYSVDHEKTPKKFDIHKVLKNKTGAWQVVYTIFTSVARRLGVRCTLVYFPERKTVPSIAWKKRYVTYKQEEDENSEESSDEEEESKRDDDKFFALEIFEGPRTQHEECDGQEVDLKEVFSEMALKDLPLALSGQLRGDLMEELFPHNDNEQYKPSKQDFFDKVNRTNLEAKICDTTDNLDHLSEEHFEEYILEMPEDDTRPRLGRCEDVKYAVGMMVLQPHLNLNCVVTGWEVGRSKIWYDVLCSDSGVNFFKQAEIVPIIETEKVRINHEEIGRYFTEFNGHFYVPNKQLEIVYPQDVEVRKKMFETQLEIKRILEENKRLKEENRAFKSGQLKKLQT